MSALPRPGRPLAPEDWRELGLQLATRLIATVRMGRSYAIGNPVFTGQLEQLLDVLAPAFAAAGEARLVERDGDLALNDVPLPARPTSARLTEQLAQELRVRAIAGLRFGAGLERAELELFMRYFLSSEVYKGGELERACATQGIAHVGPIPAAAATPAVDAVAAAAPAGYARALEAWARAAHDARTLLAAGAPRGVGTRLYRRVVQPLVDAALAGDAVTAGLADLDVARPGDWLHGLRVSLLAIAAGRGLGLDRAALSDVGVAALLHALHSPRACEPPLAEPRLRVLAALAGAAPLDPPVLAAMRVALDAAGPDDAGDAGSGLVAIADAYVSLASARPHGVPRWTPADALGLVLGPLAPGFHPALRAALVHALGTYPPGQVVELDDGSIARVCAADPAAPARPLLEPVAGPAGERVAEPARGVVTLPAERRVRRAVPFAHRASPRAA